jgi:hypothetical protein
MYMTSFDWEQMTPQDIRDAGFDLAYNADACQMLESLMNYIDTDTLGQFIDDVYMGRQ